MILSSFPESAVIFMSAGGHHSKTPLWGRLARSFAGVMAGWLLAGCSEIAYYGHIVHGEVSLLDRRVPIAKVLADPDADASIKPRLQLVLDARRYAVSALSLPDNGSYTVYADLGRSYAVWNVFAAPE